MRYRIRHTTTFHYPAPVSVCQNLVCLTPRRGRLLTSHRAELDIRPRPGMLNRRIDAFGNAVHLFAIESPHQQLSITATADVTVIPPELPELTPTAPWEAVVAGVAEQTDPAWFEAAAFVYDSPMAERSDAVRQYAQPIFTPGRPILDAALALTEQIHRDFEYLPGSTHVKTHSDEALEQRRGVCQDFAHVQIAALRSLGVPARYASGYLRTVPPQGRPRLIGADQSHAWVSVYCGPELRWVDLDPTNNVACATDHIILAYGRDYTDVAPVRGVYVGGGDGAMSVQVDVEPAG